MFKSGEFPGSNNALVCGDKSCGRLLCLLRFLEPKVDQNVEGVEGKKWAEQAMQIYLKIMLSLNYNLVIIYVSIS
jgi:hypothetical protein